MDSFVDSFSNAVVFALVAIAFVIGLCLATTVEGRYWEVEPFDSAIPFIMVSCATHSMGDSLDCSKIYALERRPAALGDVIVYRRVEPSSPLRPSKIIHRAVYVDGTCIVTKGDNPQTNPIPDEYAVNGKPSRCLPNDEDYYRVVKT